MGRALKISKLKLKFKLHLYKIIKQFINNTKFFYIHFIYNVLKKHIDYSFFGH